MTTERARERRGIMFILSSPSGAGKSTITRRLLEKDPAFTLSVSATTRPKREGEVEGVHYYFVDKKEFSRMVEAGEMLEHATVFGNSYGTPRAPVEATLAEGRDILFDIDWQGAQQIGASDLVQSVVKVFILPPSINELERRLRERAADSDTAIEKRMSKARDEISHWAEYEYVLINDDLDQCLSQIETIIAAERLKWQRQKWVFPSVNALYREFEEGRE
ncbi:guanylate kinase [Rhodobacteraceae bacterium NNCM2]|nr:guanylate kinase [Coraliihabitans acroporae]